MLTVGASLQAYAPWDGLFCRGILAFFDAHALATATNSMVLDVIKFGPDRLSA